MAIDPRTEAERAYDAERSGSLYAKPEPADEPLDQEDEQLIDLMRWAGEQLDIAREADRVIAAEQTDTPLSPAAEEIIGILFGKPVVFVPSRDEAHRQERLNRMLDHIIDLPEPDQTKAIRFMEGLLDGLLIGRAIAGDDDTQPAA